jgi:CheY-like chemotaxis protein
LRFFLRFISSIYVEDNLSNLTLIEEALREQPGVELLSAGDGHLGLEMARIHSPNLIFFDLHLPDVSGRPVLSQLHADERTCYSLGHNQR